MSRTHTPENTTQELTTFDFVLFHPFTLGDVAFDDPKCKYLHLLKCLSLFMTTLILLICATLASTTDAVIQVYQHFERFDLIGGQKKERQKEKKRRLTVIRLQARDPGNKISDVLI